LDLTDVSKRDKKQAFFGAIAIALVIAVVAPPAVQAAIQRVRVKGPVNAKIWDSQKNTVRSEGAGAGAGNTLGLLGAEGSDGALHVQTFGGGGGLLGTGDCTADAATSRPNTVTVAANADRVVTAIIITGTDAAVSVRAPDLDDLIGPFPVNTFLTTAQNPNVFVGLGNGLTVSPSELVFTCTAAGGGDGSGNFTILGQ
jgi:hypothetical protein